jgi:hypothetical protein
MPANATFNDLLEAVDRLSPDEQADLIAVVRRRLIERARQRVIADAEEARAEFERGEAKPVTVDELMGEIDS